MQTGRYQQQFRFPRMSREQLSRAFDYCKASRHVAPTFLDWLRDRLIDELAFRLESRSTPGRALRGARHERSFHELPVEWTGDDLAAALIWCHAAIYAMKDYKLGKLADVLNKAIVVAAAARLRQTEKNHYGRQSA